MRPKEYFHRVQVRRESRYVYLPKAWTDILKLDKGDTLKITDHKNGKLTIEKAR